MLFSFLVPVYNVEKYLRECIESLLIQKGAQFEIVLLDDGSTDSSGDICDEYANKYPDIIRVIHKENEGLLMTRRRGFSEAKGDWFICVDSDDYVVETLLEQVVLTIDREDCDMVMYNYQYIDDNGNQIPSRLNLKERTIYTANNKKELYRKRLFSTDINSMCIRAIRRNLMDFETDYRNFGIRNMCEDAIQILPLYTKSQKVVYINQVLYCYRKNSESITGSVSWETWKSINTSFKITQAYLDIWNISEIDKKCFYTKQMEVICNEIRWIFETEDNLEKRKALVKIVKEESVFDECRKHFNKKNCSTLYTKLSVPFLIRCIDDNLKMNILKIIFALEKTIRRG